MTLILQYVKKMEPKGIIKGIELDRVFKIGNLEFKRIDDVIIEIGGKDIFFDAKAWSPDHIRQYLNDSMSGKLIQGELQQDQLFKYILYMNKNKDYKSIRWAFDSRNTDAAKIRGYIMEAFDKNKDRFGKALKVNFDSPAGRAMWSRFRTELNTGLQSFVEILPKA